MSNLTINATTRTIVGSKAKTLYRIGQVPAVVYGYIEKPAIIQVDVKEFANLYKTAGETHVIDIVIDGGKAVPCLVQDLDINPVTRKLRNIDFKAVNLKVKTTAEVPVILVGEAPVVKTHNGIITLKAEVLEVEALPANIPDHITIDISKMIELDSHILVQDIIIDGKYEFINEGDTLVVSVETETEEQPETSNIVTEETVAPTATTTK
jgi:large subunit ribosomal protein L25